MSTMMQLTYVEPRHLSWREVPLPTLASAQGALVRPLAVARCDLDFYIGLGQYRTPGPFALGHEIAGVVLEVGDAVTSVQPGDRVIVPFQINCGQCVACQRGWTNACSAVPPTAAYGLGTNPAEDFGGGFSDCVSVPYADAMLVKIPGTLTMAAACGLSDNVADGYRTVAPHLQRFPQSPVLVVGGLAKSVGLYAVQAALACGSERVTYIDADTQRLQQAKKLGAQAVKLDVNEVLQTDEQFLITVDTNCTPAGTAFAIRSTAPCGFCTSVSGGLQTSTTLPWQSAYLKGIHYDVSRVHARATLPEVLEHTCCQRMNPLAIADTPLRFEDAVDAWLDPAAKLIFIRE